MWPQLSSDAARRSALLRAVAEGTRSSWFWIVALLLLTFTLGTVAVAQQELVSEIEIHGNRRIPAETIRARMFTKAGDAYDQQNLERDFNSLWNTGYFEDLRIEREDTEKGIILDIFVRERPNIREINYKGISRNAFALPIVVDR